MSTDLLLEIGTEEIPARFLPIARAALGETAAAALADWQLGHDTLDVLGTPRRMVLLVRGLAEKQDDYSETVTGPPWDRAFEDGTPTKAAQGFAKKQGIDPNDLQPIETPKGMFAGFTAERTGQQTRDLLQEAIPGWIGKLPFGKNMRWEASGIRFARPVRWLVALLGNNIIPVEFAGLQAGRTSSGHRFYGGPFEVQSAEQYLEAITAQQVILRPAVRRERIVAEGSKLAEAQELTVDWDASLLDEVTDLIEWPTPLIGQFDAAFLELPDMVLEAPMKQHQKYFPLRDTRGRIANQFLVVSNQPEDPVGKIKAGNERVLSARLSDAKFFWDQDRKLSLDQHAEALVRITWQEGLGTLADLKERTGRLAEKILPWFSGDAKTVARAADLYLADLGTQMVFEFAELQGEIGAIYAEKQGEPDAVVQTMREAHIPGGPDDDLPRSGPGLALSIAHRIDLITGNLIAGHEVTGSQDPYGMRRAAIGLFRMFAAIETHNTPASLCRDLLAHYRDVNYLSVKIPDNIDAAITQFWATRLGAYLEHAGHDAASAKAVVAVCNGHVNGALARLNAMQDYFVDDARKERFLDTYKRLRNIAREQPAHDDLSEFWQTTWNDDDTQPFFAALQQAHENLVDLLSKAETTDALFACLEPVLASATQLFDDVKINADDPRLADTRKSLVKAAQQTFDLLANFDLYISGGSA